MTGLPDPEETKRIQAIEQERWNRIDQLIHRVFAQNEQGAELLATWKEALIMNPTVTENSTQFQAGINEGQKTFIRNIINTISMVGGDNE
jgi:hypothetical protein